MSWGARISTVDESRLARHSLSPQDSAQKVSSKGFWVGWLYYYRKYLNSELQPFRPSTFVLFPVHSRSGLLPPHTRIIILHSHKHNEVETWKSSVVWSKRDTKAMSNKYYIHGVIFSPSQNKGVRSWFPCPPVGAFHYLTIPPQALCKWLGKPNTNAMWKEMNLFWPLLKMCCETKHLCI